ncbi:hypothetical protein C810_01402 [Lachnospiraceae bacterium A2]|jgi:hypothetical protein|nr:hypothetical protein C810_01402 [Lachnospiraceae bacterium A2]
MLTLEYELLEDLKEELSATDPKFKPELIKLKIKNAIREVKRARNYPKHYTESAIVEDLENYYSNIRNIALFDYNMIGAEGQSSSSENGTSRNFIDRDKLFSGIIPLSRTGR